MACVALMTMSCRPGDQLHLFALSIHNLSDSDLRLRVNTAGGGPEPEFDILAPAHGPLLETPPDAMDLRVDGSAEPVVVSIFTKDCVLIATLTVGAGRTLIEVQPGLTPVTRSVGETALGAAGPDLALAC